MQAVISCYCIVCISQIFVAISTIPVLVAGAAATKPPPPVIYCEVGVSHLYHVCD